jgi:hypothetical protein
MAILLPIVLAYTAFTDFRGRVRAGEGYHCGGCSPALVS